MKEDAITKEAGTQILPEEINWHFYLSGREAWTAMLDACERADKSIDFEQYVFSNDEISQKFVELFIRKQKAGVRVRVLCDTVGGWALFNSSLPREMRESGVDIRFFNVVSPWRIGSFFSWFFRDHRKILVIDGKIGFTGGVGIRNEMASWRDTHVKVSGPIVLEMERAFNELWAQAAEKDILSRIKKIKTYAKGFHFVINAPYWRKRFIYHDMVEAIRSAQKYIYLTTPYLVPDNRFLRILRLAVQRGVDVRIIVPKQSNMPFVERASQAHFDMLLEPGVRIFQYHHGFLHAKTAVIDDEWATVGSFNLDSLSFTYNYEANIVSTENTFIDEVKKHFANDLKYTRELSLAEWRARPFVAKFREWLVMPLRRFL